MVHSTAFHESSGLKRPTIGVSSLRRKAVVFKCAGAVKQALIHGRFSKPALNDVSVYKVST